jgi:hypothetical protein
MYVTPLALLAGRLPFDELPVLGLLAKAKSGKCRMPVFDADLISRDNRRSRS